MDDYFDDYEYDDYAGPSDYSMAPVNSLKRPSPVEVDAKQSKCGSMQSVDKPHLFQGEILQKVVEKANQNSLLSSKNRPHLQQDVGAWTGAEYQVFTNHVYSYVLGHFVGPLLWQRA
jgi:hypothetical protein